MNWEEMCKSVGFSDRDSRHLQALQSHAEEPFGDLVGTFLDAILSESTATGPEASLLREQVTETLGRLLGEMLQGPHDLTYYQRRQEVARAYSRLNIPPRRLFFAASRLRDSLSSLAIRAMPTQQAWETVRAVNRIIDLDLTVITTTYMRIHEAQQLRSLQDLIVRNMPVTVLSLDATGRVTAATRPSARLFGQGAQVGLFYEDFLPTSLIEAADLPTKVGQALSTGEEVSIPRIVMGHGPDARHFRIQVVPLEHEIARILLHIEELTEVVRAEARIQQAESLARIGALAGTMAHVFRNPLTAIYSSLQVISTSFDPTDRRWAIMEKLHEQVTRMDRIISDLLQYARPAEPRILPVDLETVARDAIRATRVEATLTLAHADPPPPQGTWAKADPELTTWIVSHLLQNARDACAGGPIWVHVGPGPEIRVQDSGPGVAPDLVERLFTPFVTTKARGTGLGLAICRKLAEAMSGTLALEPSRVYVPNGPFQDGSAPGACFRLALPSEISRDRASPAGNEARTG